MNEPVESLLLQSADTNEAQRDFENFLEAHKSHTGKAFKCTEKNRPLLRIFGNSRFLSRHLQKHPQLINQIADSPYLAQEKKLPHFLDELGRLEKGHEAPEFFLAQMRLYKYQEFLRMTAKDLNGANQQVILREISALAYAIMNYADKLALQNSILKFGKPLTKKKTACEHFIIAMGKMGGHELNYSSDVDLISCYTTDEGSAGNESLREFYVHHASTMTRLLQERDETGFLYRVDWDLRPSGKDGPLTNSLSSLENYYWSVGADWERQAMIKAQYASGSVALFHEFQKIILPFVYRRYYDLDGLKSVWEIKNRILASLKTKEEKGFNVKLGIGGIREIEFFIQGIQLIYGGRRPEIRSANTIDSIDHLGTHKLITPYDVVNLKEAYYFLRKTEHRLQMIDEAQTHTIPHSETERTRLARRMGYFTEGTPAKDLDDFTNDLNKTTKIVHGIFENFFDDKKNVFYSIAATSLGKSPEEVVYEYREDLTKKLLLCTGYEQLLDELRRFKREHVKKIIELETMTKATRQEICLQLSMVGEAICKCALNMATIEVEKQFGRPTYLKPDGKVGESQICLIGMGKLGGYEIGYASDLDLICVYSENGETSGPRIITNSEYFNRLVQKFISIISIPTYQGFAYQIDTDLRPSGRSGPLVVSLEGFLDYQASASQIWEKQALLRARPIAGSITLSKLLKAHIESILFSARFPEVIGKEIHRLRMRVEIEKAKEDYRWFDYKLGLGGIMDIEFIVQYLQLRWGFVLSELRIQNTFELLEAIQKLKFLPPEIDVFVLTGAYSFYRDMESRIALEKQRSYHRLTRDDELLDLIAPSLGFKSGKELLRHYFSMRSNVRNIYNEIFKSQNND